MERKIRILLAKPGLDGHVCPLPHSLQPNMHFSIERGSNTISSILKMTECSAPNSIAISLKFFASFCVLFFIILPVIVYICRLFANNV